MRRRRVRARRTRRLYIESIRRRVKKEVLAAGFVFVGSSDLLRSAERSAHRESVRPLDSRQDRPIHIEIPSSPTSLRALMSRFVKAAASRPQGRSERTMGAACCQPIGGLSVEYQRFRRFLGHEIEYVFRASRARYVVGRVLAVGLGIGRLRCAPAAARSWLCRPRRRRKEFLSIRVTVKVPSKPTGTAMNVMCGQSSKPAWIRAVRMPIRMSGWWCSRPRRRAPTPRRAPSRAPSLVPSLPGPRNAGAGLVLGGATGAIVGSAADANAQAQAQQTQQQINQVAAAGRAQADSYRRALGACLQGRGYTVS